MQRYTRKLKTTGNLHAFRAPNRSAPTRRQVVTSLTPGAHALREVALAACVIADAAAYSSNWCVAVPPRAWDRLIAALDKTPEVRLRVSESG